MLGAFEVAVSALSLAVAGSCGVVPTTPGLGANRAQREASAGVVRDGLAAYPDFSRWPNNVAICFANGLGDEKWGSCAGSLDQASFDTLSASLFGSLQSTWDSASALAFSRSEDCGSTGEPPAGTIRIKLTLGFCGGVCGGNGTTGNCLVSAGNMDQVINRIAVHEVGHALGFGHEHQRAAGGQWEVPLCAAEQTRYDRAMQVIAHGSSLCFQDGSSEGSDPVVVDNEETCSGDAKIVTVGTANGTKWNDEAISLSDLTAFDPLSMMNYCSMANGRRPEDPLLTSLDVLGTEIMYPYSLTRVLRVGPSAAFTTGAPDGALVAREDAQVLTDWSERGAADAVFVGTSWYVDDLLHGIAQPRFPLSALSSGSHAIRFSSIDVFGRALAGGPTPPINANTALHTAILVSVLP